MSSARLYEKDQYTKINYFYALSNLQYKNEMKETIPFIITSKRVKYLRINLTKLMQDVQVKIITPRPKN